MKRIKQGAALVMLAICAVGCCTQRLSEYAHQTTRDTFLPHTLFQQTNGNRIAFEGTLYKNVPSSVTYAGNGTPRCLVLPDTDRGWHTPVKGKERRWFDDNYHAFCELANESMLQVTMPPGYRKVPDFPKTWPSIPMPDSERQPHMGAMALAPLTVIADVILSPFQLMGFAMLGIGHHC
jgi:hypothetical protein